MSEQPFAPDLKDPGLYEASMPHEVFRRLRAEAPVYWNPEADGAGFWALTRFEHIAEVSRQPLLFSSAHENGGHRIFNENEVSVANSGDAGVGTPFISLDPPRHLQYRSLIGPGLTAARLADMEARIRARSVALLDAMPAAGEADIVEALAAPLPLLTLIELMDVGPEMLEPLFRWTNAFVGEDDPDFRTSPEEMGRVMGEFIGWCQALYDDRRARPGGDLASLLAAAVVDGEPMSFADFLGNMILVLVGGNETTRNSISHSIVSFAAAPDQWAALGADRGRLKTAVREMVRHACPVMHMRRTATADTEVGGVRIRKGDKVVMWYASANRDEAAFADPDRFDMGRGEIRHLGFGAGQHVCVGQRLAELQLRVVFDLLLDRYAGFELLASPRRFRSNFINGLKDVRVRLEPARR